MGVLAHTHARQPIETCKRRARAHTGTRAHTLFWSAILSGSLA